MISKLLDEKTRQAIFNDNWPIRRRWMKWSLLWMGANIEALICWTIWADGNAIGLQIIMTLLAAIVSILMFYIFGAVWDDNSKRRFWSRGDTGDCDNTPTLAPTDTDPPGTGEN